MTAYYNEFNEEAAEWLLELIKQGHIAPGDVDTRSIEDVRPDDLRGYTQCHFFAGIGVWSHALRRSGWADDRPIWTGSCPCQPFSAAGKGAAFDDERHLWPAFHHLIKVGKPAIVLGEQVASAAVDAWIDLVHADVEALGYAFGSIPFPSAGVGAPHIRDRNYWVANADGQQRSSRQRAVGTGDEAQGWKQGSAATSGLRHADGLGDTSGQGLAQRERERGILSGAPGAVKGEAAVGAGVHIGGLADAERARVRGESRSEHSTQAGARDREHLHDPVAGSDAVRPGPTNGYWADADWLGCRDGKWRPVEPRTFPLANGAPARVGRLRGYGNAINAAAAQAWIETVMECIA